MPTLDEAVVFTPEGVHVAAPVATPHPQPAGARA